MAAALGERRLESAWTASKRGCGTRSAGKSTDGFVLGGDAACSRWFSTATPPEEAPIMRNPEGVPAGLEDWWRLGFPGEVPRGGGCWGGKGSPVVWTLLEPLQGSDSQGTVVRWCRSAQPPATCLESLRDAWGTMVRWSGGVAVLNHRLHAWNPSGMHDPVRLHRSIEGATWLNSPKHQLRPLCRRQGDAVTRMR
jgi:hypothetical protein